MIHWLLQTLPSAVFEPFFTMALAGILLLVLDRRAEIVGKAQKILLLTALAFMLCWRLPGAQGSSRYSNLLIPLFLLFGSFFCMRLLDWVPRRFSKAAAVVLFSAVFIACAAKIVRQYDPYRIRMFENVGKCIRTEKSKVCLICDNHDAARMAWYAGIPDFIPVTRTGSSPEETLQALFRHKNRDGVFYVLLQDPAGSEALTARAMQMPAEDWQFCGEFIKNKRRKNVMRLYRYKLHPHWRRIAAVPPLNADAAAVYREDFELPDGSATAEHPDMAFPAGWGVNGNPEKNVRAGLEKNHPISGRSSLFVQASIMEFLTKRAFPADRGYTIRFLVRGTKGAMLLSRVYVYPPQGGGTVLNLDWFYFEDGDLHECSIEIPRSDVPDAHTLRIAFIVYDGAVTLDDLQLIPQDSFPAEEARRR